MTSSQDILNLPYFVTEVLVDVLSIMIQHKIQNK